MKRLIVAGMTCLMASWRLPVVCQPASDSLHDTAFVIQHEQKPDSTESHYPPPEMKLAQPGANDSGNLQHLETDSSAAHTKPINQSATTGSETDSSISCPPSGFIAPSFIVDYFIEKNNRLPDGNLFLLGGKDQFIVKKRVSKWLELGMAGGPAFRAPLMEPQSFINNALYAALRGKTVEGYILVPANGSDFLNDLPFEFEGNDGGAIWVTTYKSKDFPGVELRSLQWYLRAHLQPVDLSLMIKPLAFGEHVIYKSMLYKEKYDFALRSMMLSKEEEATTDFPVRNVGIEADLAITRQIYKYLSLYIRCPVDYRKISADATRSIIAQFSYYPNDDELYQRYVKIDTLSVAPGRATYLYYSPRIGLQIDSKTRLTWPLIALPFIGQKTTLEGYYGRRRLWETGSYEWLAKYQEFGGSLTSFQNIRFGKGFFTGMENLFRTNFDCLYDGRYVESVIHTEYLPQLILNQRFFFSAFRFRMRYYFPEMYFDSYNQYSLGYANESWGFSFSITPKAWLNRSNDPDAFNVTMWRFWK